MVLLGYLAARRFLRSCLQTWDRSFRVSRFPAVPFGRSRLAVVLTTVLVTMTLGVSLAQAADLTSTASAKPKSTPVPPIVSPKTDQAPQMPEGTPGSASPAVQQAGNGPAEPVLPPT